MKKIYSIIVLAILGMVGYSAKAATVDFTLVVDVADRIVAQTFSGGFIPMPQIVPLTDGANVVTATCEQTFNILTSSEEYDIKSVTIAGVEQEISDPHQFVMYVPWDFGGTEVVVTTAEASAQGGEGGGSDVNPPASDSCSVTFDFADEASKAYILGVSIYNDPVANFANGFEVEAGTPIEITLDSSLATDEFTINGEEPFIMMGSVFYTVESNTVIRVKVHQFSDINFTVDIDDAEKAEVGYWVTIGSGWFAQRMFTPFELVNGVNHLSVNEQTTSEVSVRAKGDGNSIASIKVNGEAVEVAEETVIALSEGLTIDIITSNRQRDAVCTVNCDDFTKVALYCGATEVELTSDSQQVAFYSATESTFTFTSRGFSSHIYVVTVNGAPVASSTNGSFVVENVKDGDVIDVTTEAPAVGVHFIYANEESKAFVTRVTIGAGFSAVDVEDYDSPDFTVPMGSYITIYTNANMQANSFEVVGSELLVYPNTYEFTVGGETFVYIDAVEKEKTVININVDNAAKIKAHYTKVTFNMLGIPVVTDVEIPLTDGDNAITFDEAPASIIIDPVADNEIESITVDGVEAAAGTDIPVVSGMQIVVKTKTLDAIESIITDSVSANVYNLHGVLIHKEANADTLRQLPAGIYIIGAKKVVIR